ncbi:MAG: hypothetical protein ACOCXC_04145 [Fibrobacterota bacterium]
MNSVEVYYGSGTEVFRKHELRAGPVCLIYENGYIRSLYLGKKELVRRIYVAVRDKNWNTIEYEISEERIEKQATSFRIAFLCRHRRDDVDFFWKGKIHGNDKGEISFALDGEALSRFETWRIGFCILHPLELSGQPLFVKHANGTESEERFPVEVMPDQPVVNIRSMTFKPYPEINAVIDTRGEVFEMEDQRNWTDATFKTYCPPADDPGLHIIEKGEKVSQKVTVSIAGDTGEISENVESEPVDVEIKKGESRKVPDLGTCIPDSPRFSSGPAQLVRLLSLSHVRFDIYADSSELVEDVRRAAETVSVLYVPVELAIHFTGDFASETEKLLSALRSVQLPVRRYLIFSTQKRVTPDSLVLHVKDALRAYSPHAPVGGGTDYYYVELNRNKPETANLDFVSFSANPQVHTFDNAAVMENAAGIAEVLRDADRLAGGLPVVVSPVTLRPRRRAESPQKDGGADSRMSGLFTAAWTFKHFSSCINENADSLTYFHALGEGGLVSSSGGDKVVPAFLVLAFIAEFKDGDCLPCRSGDESIVSVLFSENNRHRVITANCSDVKRRVSLGDIGVKQARLLVLDENSYETAIYSPEAFLCARGRTLECGSGVMLDLNPFAVAVLDF